jgi:spectrin beta
MEDEMTARHTHLESVLQIGNDLISAGNFGADKIQQRIDEINQQWDSLMDLAAFRKKRLNEVKNIKLPSDNHNTTKCYTMKVISNC